MHTGRTQITKTVCSQYSTYNAPLPPYVYLNKNCDMVFCVRFSRSPATTFGVPFFGQRKRWCIYNSTPLCLVLSSHAAWGSNGRRHHTCAAATCMRLLSFPLLPSAAEFPLLTFSFCLSAAAFSCVAVFPEAKDRFRHVSQSRWEYVNSKALPDVRKFCFLIRIFQKNAGLHFIFCCCAPPQRVYTYSQTKRQEKGQLLRPNRSGTS